MKRRRKIMVHGFRWMSAAALVVGVAIVTHVAGHVSAQQAQAPVDVAAVKKEVKAASDQYFRLFSEHKMQSLDESYNVPLITLGPNAIVARTTREQVIERAVNSYNQWLPETTGYLRSEMPNPTICVLNAGAAIVSGKWYRIKQDGSQMTESGIAYFWGKTNTGWRMAGWAVTDKVVPCGD
jgi:hypothetical protein